MIIFRDSSNVAQVILSFKFNGEFVNDFRNVLNTQNTSQKINQ